MRTLHMLWAGLTGFLVDNLLSMLIVPLSYAAANIDINNPNSLNIHNPIHILAGLVVPALMTLIGGGVAGYIAPTDARPAGALVGGFGILIMAFGGGEGLTLPMIVSQCVATVGSLIVADLVGRRKLRSIV